MIIPRLQRQSSSRRLSNTRREKDKGEHDCDSDYSVDLMRLKWNGPFKQRGTGQLKKTARDYMNQKRKVKKYL